MEYGIRNMEYGIWNTEHGIQNMEYGIWIRNKEKYSFTNSCVSPRVSTVK